MKRNFATAFLLSSLLASAALSQETAATYKFDQGYPTAETSARAQDNADLQRALVAYRFWYPTVSVEGIFNGNRAVGINDNEAMGGAAAGPRQIGFTLNSDTPYGSATLDVSKGPIVVELPPGAYIGLVNDHNQGWVLDMGLPGPDAGKGGKHLIVGPDYRGKIPKGYLVGRTPTYKNLLAVRALPVGGDQDKALKALEAIKVYPLADPKQRLKFVDTTTMDLDSTSLKWEDNIQFWQKLNDIIQQEPVVEKFLPMYGLLQALGIEKGKDFKPDDRMKAILEKAAKDGRDQLLVSALDSGRADKIAWSDRKWEWVGLVPGSAQFETRAGVDLEARDRWFAQAIVTSPAMFRRTAGAGSLYWLGARDASGAWLDGGKTYKLSIPQPVPGKLFWSVTAYDAQTRSEVQTDQGKAALRSLFELKDVKGSDAVDLYFGPTAPQGQEGRWIKTVPGRGWFAYIRIYGPDKPAFDGTWKPADFVEVK
ncbi:DUF1254 domain-containing protein [Rhizobium sp. CNPSo 4062]|uniref:DUF1254 domain-containing protein n=1 Tax=Rhizobium sp. CNPSo 4062 TaxID=3021410 RepID=UPI00254A78DB|nr:DUF1254 domain-containing protein [Rhizobium sp. CNPSo 4062]MDK4700913.1 DUF1254 domain-containing protein [Rhizobium sp. CNPSo 4062]